MMNMNNVIVDTGPNSNTRMQTGAPMMARQMKWTTMANQSTKANANLMMGMQITDDEYDNIDDDEYAPKCVRDEETHAHGDGCGHIDTYAH